MNCSTGNAPHLSLLEACRQTLGLSADDAAMAYGEPGRALMLRLWEELGARLYEHPLYLVRQEWWHATSATWQPPAGFFRTLHPQATLLDWGCGTAELMRPWIERGGQTLLVERSALCRRYLQVKYRAYPRVRIARELDAQTGPFDAVVCTDVYEHLPAPLEVHDMLWQALKPGGQMLSNFSRAYPHAGHLPASIAQFPQWLERIQPYLAQVHPKGAYVWLLKPNPAS